MRDELKKRDGETLLQYRARLYRNKIALGFTNNKEVYDFYISETGDNIAESSCRCSATTYNQAINDLLEEKNKNEGFDKSILFMNDIHCPFEREDVLKIIQEHSQEITTLVIGGDLMDCESISSFPSIERKGLTEELIYTYNFMKKVRKILNNNQKIIIINGNHEERLHKVISRMQEKELQSFLNPNILEMLVDGFTIYKEGKKNKYEGIEGITYVPHWYVLIDDIVVCHPKDFSRVKGKMLENVASHFINKGFDFSTIVFGHTHKASQGIIDRYENKYVVENPCLCQPHSYSDCGKLGYSPQTYGYTIIRYNKGENVNPNNIKTYFLEEIVDITEGYKIKL